MTKKTILEYLSQHKEEFRSLYGIKKIGIFGSYARDEAHSGSDIDIIIEIEENTKNLHDKKCELKERLQNYFKLKIDIAREKYLKPLAKDEILKDVCYV